MRIAFMGTPPFAVPTLAALHAAGHEIAAVYTQPPRPAQRGKKLQQSAVHDWADAHDLPVRTPKSLRSEEAQAEFTALDLDIAVVAAYGLILPQAILDAPREGCLNVHGSVLPRWRGAAPVQRAILAGDAETGVTIMQMDIGLDTGAMRLVETTPVARKTAGLLTDELAEMGALMMVKVLSDLHAFAPAPQPDEGVTYAAKIDKSEARLDFLTSAVQVERQIRAFNPMPGAFFELDGERYKILAAEVVHPAETVAGAAPGVTLDDALTIACNPGAIRAMRVQRAGKPAMDAAELLRGRPVPMGTRLA
ncbi:MULTISPECIES: methionyl-tRNA formyltransferase [unclassified Sphingopyxis]|uniref:methionyl-tRNA formyltransferase n=1 Tax=unclassified Sphingopyxis TaxID=2614943 RepID=UPI00072FD785|nr:MULTISPECIES: methionyl-tRNA formyltransferase [unclassified Sphingopyxis]KTE26464.1 methionyl-tRNA formyltransferase [Sphingopyxis sp. H057]KTE52869.1 methionyl-tRNA formyltransferase [Sphingopyxis sp. H073]KTE55058.1 methionyl-tRNA formyltransferase [Sphingopyxis sp. H071]KTE62519.1 methionyl-tRNA formyltransferase [Sphingopyxis sp. H107]KTE66064.1 methionyl-tRNA formyltransferase [Sphingopyxis sp. H100]